MRPAGSLGIVGAVLPGPWWVQTVTGEGGIRDVYECTPLLQAFRIVGPVSELVIVALVTANLLSSMVYAQIIENHSDVSHGVADL